MKNCRDVLECFTRFWTIRNSFDEFSLEGDFFLKSKGAPEERQNRNEEIVMEFVVDLKTFFFEGNGDFGVGEYVVFREIDVAVGDIDSGEGILAEECEKVDAVAGEKFFVGEGSLSRKDAEKFADQCWLGDNNGVAAVADLKVVVDFFVVGRF